MDVEACVLEPEPEPKSNVADAVAVTEVLRVDVWEPKLDSALVVGVGLEFSEVDVGDEPPIVSVPPPSPSHVSPVGQQPLLTQYSPFRQ